MGTAGRHGVGPGQGPESHHHPRRLGPLLRPNTHHFLPGRLEWRRIQIHYPLLRPRVRLRALQRRALHLPRHTQCSSDQLCASGPPFIGCPAIEYTDPAFRNPRVSNLTVGVEHGFSGGWTLSFDYAYMHSWHLKTGGFSTSNWQRNFVPIGTDQFGRSILASTGAGVPCPANGVPVGGGEPMPLDCTLTPFSGALELASFSHGNYHQLVASVNKRFSNHFQWFANYTW